MVNKKTKRVLLVDPPVKYPQVLNTGLGWLAANLTDTVERVRVLGLANIPCSIERAGEILRQNIISFKPDIVGFNIHCNTYSAVLEIVKNIRGYFQGIVAIGGPHAFYERGLILEKSPQTDIVVIGEAEFTFAEVCRRPFGEYDGIEGVVFRKGNTIVENPVNSFKKDFGILRYPDYRQFGINKIHCPYPISTSRGCPFSCSFCNPFMGGKHWRPRPLEDVFSELNFARETFGIKSFVLVEPVFNLKPDRVISFCEELLRRKINLPWYNGSGIRADFITPETVRLMKKSGCTLIKIGVETLVPDIFKHINKGESIDDIKRAVRIIKSERMPLYGSFIIGLPYDTLEAVRLNYELSKNIGFDYTEWSLLFPYPGTRAYDWMKANGKIYHSIETAHQVSFDLNGQDTVNIACDTADFTREEREKAFWEINTKSGNYVVSLNASDRDKLKVIFKAILKYDSLRIGWHIGNLFRLFMRRMFSTDSKGKRFTFGPEAF